jgi:hypothetical protein
LIAVILFIVSFIWLDSFVGIKKEEFEEEEEEEEEEE